MQHTTNTQPARNNNIFTTFLPGWPDIADDEDEDSDPSRVGTWIFALLLAALLALAVACLCCCVERGRPKKERVAVAWMDKPILKHLAGGNGNSNSPVVSEMMSEGKVYMYVCSGRAPPVKRHSHKKKWPKFPFMITTLVRGLRNIARLWILLLTLSKALRSIVATK